jgi:hypothetical protein
MKLLAFEDTINLGPKVLKALEPKVLIKLFVCIARLHHEFVLHFHKDSLLRCQHKLLDLAVFSDCAHQLDNVKIFLKLVDCLFVSPHILQYSIPCGGPFTTQAATAKQSAQRNQNECLKFGFAIKFEAFARKKHTFSDLHKV